MRIIILTAVPRGMASLALPALAAAGHDIAAVVFAHAVPVSRTKQLKTRLRKTMRIGILGALNGIRIRPWFTELPADVLGLRPIADVAREHGVPFIEVNGINSPESVAAIRDANADLAISLGNSYIARRVFELPRFGTINIHHEVLPEFRGAHTVLWQLHEGRAETGYSIHRIDATIDGGNLLMVNSLPMELAPTLRDTVVANCARVYRASVDGLLAVLADFQAIVARTGPQGAGRSFTTPSFRQFLRMRRNHRRLFEAQSGR